MCGAQFPTCTVVHMSFPRYAWYMAVSGKQPCTSVYLYPWQMKFKATNQNRFKVKNSDSRVIEVTTFGPKCTAEQ